MRYILVALIAQIVLSLRGLDARHDPSAPIAQAAEKRAHNLHRVDTLILLLFVALLVLIVLTSWFFKHHRLQFIHETGLTLCYGLLIGLLLRYTNIGVIESQTIDVVQRNGTAVREPPDYLRLEVEPLNVAKVQFHYELIEGLFGDKKQQSERQLEQKAVFSPEIFFNILLPPIIFNAGYSLKKRHFFRNIGSILAFVFVGTTVSSLVTGLLMFVFCWVFGLSFSLKEMFFFGSILSATDPVTVLAVFQDMRVEADLFALVFGESVLNDAVAIVLSSSIDSFSASQSFDMNALFAAALDFITVFFGSLFLGSVIGCSNALLTKLTEIHEFPLLESALFILLSYLSFLLAEFVELTGIVAVLFCAICQAHYTYNNLSEEAQMRTKQFFQVIGFLSESFIFCYIGVSVFVSHSQRWNVLFLFATLFSIVVARAVHIYPICAMLNIHRNPQIPRSYQHMLLFSGLRGAMAFALAYRNTATDNRQVMATTTSMVVILTVFLNGGLTSWMVDRLKIKHGSEARDESQMQIAMGEGQSLEGNGGAETPSRVSGQNPWDKAFLPRKWYNFDASFMKPLLTHANPTLMETLPTFCMPFAKLFTTRRQMNLYTQAMESGSLDSRQPNGDNPFTRVRYYNSVDHLSISGMKF
uniref:Sodium/hydrogen exchanger n=1 Tax=Parascaris univalens TaxID=6257 RepID=A0A915AKI2_PARUN